MTRLLRAVLFLAYFSLHSSLLKSRSPFAASKGWRLKCTGSDDNADFGFEVIEPGEQRSPSSSSSVDASKQSKKYALAFLSTFVGAGIGFYQHIATPLSGLGLLHRMEQESIPFSQVTCSAKPAIIEFYADWCEVCKKTAPDVRALEYKYGDKINFVTINAVRPQNERLVSAFHVDGIPHFAFVNSHAEVETALVGGVPSAILDAELSALAEGKTLPYAGYDAFASSGNNKDDDDDKARRTLTPADPSTCLTAAISK